MDEIVVDNRDGGGGGDTSPVPANIEYLYIRIYGFVYSVYSNMGFNRYPPYSKLRVFLVILYIPYSISGYPLTPNIEYGVYGNLYIRYSGIPLTPIIEYE